ncbi:MAG: hypothetical protein ROW52_08245 [Anaerolineaceae bacterium]|jgi:hypothetical protein
MKLHTNDSQFFLRHWATRLIQSPVALISILTFLIYLRGISAQFVAEDFIFLQPSAGTLSDVWQSILTSSRARPVIDFFHWLMYQFFATTPHGYHLVSLTLHGINILLVHRFASWLSGSKQIGLAAALIFALYPRHHQPLLWMASSHVTLVYLFSLICLNCYTRFLDTKKISWYILTLVSLVMALFTQEGSVVLFPLLVAVELFSHLRDKPFSLSHQIKALSINPLKKYIPIFLVFLLFLFVTFGGQRLYKLSGIQFANVEEMQSAGFQRGDAYSFTIGMDTIQDMAAYLTYAVYPHIPLRALDPTFAAMLLTAVTVLILLFSFIKGPGLARFALISLFISILPFIFFTPYGNADRYFYFMSVSFSIFAACYILTISDWVKKTFRSFPIPLSTIVLTAYLLISAWMINERINDWQKAGELADRILEQSVALIPNPEPGSSIVYIGLPQQVGQAYVFTSGFSTAIDMRYGSRADGVTFYQSHDEQAIAYLKSADPLEKSVENLHVVLYEDGVLKDKSNYVADIDAIIPGSFFRW